jgi:predicted molibdopterin-dependent oxidoreductase YjgC
LLKKNNKGIYPMDNVMSAIDGRRLVRAHGDRKMPVSLQDCARLELRNGDRVKVKSRYGAAHLPVRINPAMKRSELFATFIPRRCS